MKRASNFIDYLLNDKIIKLKNMLADTALYFNKIKHGAKMIEIAMLVLVSALYLPRSKNDLEIIYIRHRE